MPSPAISFWIDMTTGKLLSGWQSISYAQKPVFKQGDLLGIELHIIKNYLGGSFAEYEFSPSTAVTLAIGRVDTAPESGSFKLVYGANTTSAINAGASATEVQTALNAIASITSEGGVVVSKVNNSYRIVWNNPSVTSNTLSYSFNELYPTSSISSSIVKVGSVSQKQIYQLHIKQAPVANVTSFVNQDEPEISVSQTHTPSFSGDTKVWRVSISPQPKSGSFLIGFNVGTNSYNTQAIDVNSSGDSLLTILNSAYAGVWSVVKSGPNQWDISTTETSVFNLSVTDSGINAFNSKYGLLDLDTAEVEYLIAGEPYADAVMEIQLDTNGVKHTVIQQDVTILNDLIDDASYNLVNWGDYIPADSVVRYDTAQSLTNAQKTQAKQNIGVSEIDTTALTNKDIELEGRIGDLESVVITQNQYDSINASDSPSQTNAIITQSSLTSQLSVKANTNHSHAISDITGLQSAIDGKSPTSHTHSISDVTGLQTTLDSKVSTTVFTAELNNKANATHTHTTIDTLYVDTLSSSTISVDGLAMTHGIVVADAIAFPQTPSTIEWIGVPELVSGSNYVLPVKINNVLYNIPMSLRV